MQIWVDADACPGAIKDILFRAAEREQVQVTRVANRALRIPPSPYLRLLQVPPGLDAALSPRDRQAFANSLDSFLARRAR